MHILYMEKVINSAGNIVPYLPGEGCCFHALLVNFQEALTIHCWKQNTGQQGLLVWYNRALTLLYWVWYYMVYFPHNKLSFRFWMPVKNWTINPHPLSLSLGTVVPVQPVIKICYSARAYSSLVYFRKNIVELDKVQKRATKMIDEI